MKKIWLKSGLVAIGAVFSLVLFPRFVFAATESFTPSSGNFSVGSTFNVSVLVNTQGAAVNTAEASISFSTNTLQLVSVKQGSNFYLTSPGSPGTGSGTVYFGGGLPTPGYTGNGGVLGTMTFRATAVGTATVSVGSGHVLLNDGLGTDAMSGSSGARFTIAPPSVGAVRVSSSTHPNQDSWYAAANVDLSWDRPSGAYGYSFELDQNPDTVPDNVLDTTITTTKSYTGLKDGIWYFHIKARPQSATAAFGTTTHFKIQVDTTAPDAFQVNLNGFTLTFEAKDAPSGIDHYEVSSNGKVIEANATSPYTLTNLQSGTNQITVTAVDRAGNTSQAQTTITIKGIGFFNKTLQVPLYLILLLILLILILMIIIIILALKKKQHRAGSLEEIAKLELQLKTLNKEVDKTKTKIEQKINKIKKARG